MPDPATPIFPSDCLSLTELLREFKLSTDEPLASQVYRILRDEIVALNLRPGQLVSEKEIAEVLNASKTPVREALIRLEIDGLVEIVPKSGTYVTAIRINKYIEASFTRLQLEIGAVRRAATHAMDDAYVGELDQIINQQITALESEDYVQFFMLDQALHRSFFIMAGLPGVWELLLKTQADVNRIRHLKRVKNIRRGPKVLTEHQAIVEAIRRHDAEAAEKALIKHIGSLEREIQQFSTNPALLEFIENQALPSRRSRPGRRTGN